MILPHGSCGGELGYFKGNYLAHTELETHMQFVVYYASHTCLYRLYPLSPNKDQIKHLAC